jgi:hypothetical protein
MSNPPDDGGSGAAFAIITATVSMNRGAMTTSDVARVVDQQVADAGSPYKVLAGLATWAADIVQRWAQEQGRDVDELLQSVGAHLARVNEELDDDL